MGKLRNAVPDIILLSVLVAIFIAGSPPAKTKGLKRVFVQGMYCQSCGERIREHVGNLPGIDSVKIKADRGTVDVFGEFSTLNDSTLAFAVHEAGFRAKRIESMREH